MRIGRGTFIFLAVSALIAAAAGCDRSSPPAPPKVFDDPLGPIVKSTVPLPPGVAVPEGAGPAVSYFANGFARVATPEDRRAGRSQVRFYNPSNIENDVVVTVYFDNRAPAELTRFRMRPNNNEMLLTIPKDFLDFFAGSEAWAAKIESTAPVLVLNVLAAGVIAPNGDLWFGDPRYKGSNVGAHATRRLEKQWYFADGLVLRGETETSTQRFNEYEWYHVLNPNARDTEVSMRCYYATGDAEAFTFTVKGERVRIINNKELVQANIPHAVEFNSSEPVLISAERFIYDFKETEDWGAWLHANHDGIPGSEVNDGGH